MVSPAKSIMISGATLTRLRRTANTARSVTDTDYGEADILYRARSDDAYRQFHTFTQELRVKLSAESGWWRRFAMKMD
jgi:hypothetical protein